MCFNFFDIIFLFARFGLKEREKERERERERKTFDLIRS